MSSNRIVRLHCEALMAVARLAVVANQCQGLAAAWLPLAIVGPSPHRASARYLRPHAPPLALMRSLSPSPLPSPAPAMVNRAPPSTSTAPPSPSDRSTVPLPPPSSQQLHRVPLYLLDTATDLDELR